MRVEKIVVEQEFDVFASSTADQKIAIAAGSAARRISEILQTPVRPGIDQFLHFVVGGVIADDQFKVSKCLCQRALNRLIDPGRTEGGNEDRNAGGGWHTELLVGERQIVYVFLLHR